MTRTDLRCLAYNFANELKLNHNFNHESKMAGYDWLSRFLTKHPELSVRKAEGVSLARSQGMNKEEVDSYFQLLEKLLEEHDLFNKPGHLYNVDETGLQLNNRPEKVIAQKGSKSVMTVTSGEKGETISLVACCNAEGVFLPPACIFKGKNLKKEFQDGMPAGATIFMSEKSAYITTDIFLQWLKTIFFPRKPDGKVLLLLDGHASHCSSVAVLDFCIQNDIILLCLPSHTTHYLQPLDRAVFKSLKTYFYEAASNYLKNNPGRKINRLNFGKLLDYAWGKTANHHLASKAFKATGVYPFDPSQIPDYAYLTSNDNADISICTQSDINLASNKIVVSH